MKNASYSNRQIFSHWIGFLGMLIVFTTIYFMPYYSKLLGGIGNVFTLHKSVGILIFFLTVIRLIFIKLDKTPEVLPKEQKFTRISSKAVQGCLYLVLFLMPLSGFILNSHPINFFWIFSIEPFEIFAPIRKIAKNIHLLLQWIALFLIAGHAIMALVHHYIFKDRVLKAMLPPWAR